MKNPKQQKIDRELLQRLDCLLPDERRHLLKLLKQGSILDCAKKPRALDFSPLDHPILTEEDQKKLEAFSRENWELVLDELKDANEGAIIIREFLIMDDSKGEVILYHGPSGRFRTWPAEAKSQMIEEMKESDQHDKDLIQLIWEV